MRAWLIAIVALVAAAAPRIAEACPYCAGQNDGGTGRLFVIGAMILTPFFAVVVCLPLVRRTIRRMDGSFDGADDLENPSNE